MLFDSYVFIFMFLPITLMGYAWLTSKHKITYAISFLILCSLFFYTWWNPKYLLLLLASLGVNYTIARKMCMNTTERKSNQALLILGLILNLVFIGYFKYSYFLVSNVNYFLNEPFNFEAVILPLGISFYTFQKIAFLIDASRGEVKSFRFIDFCFFITFFPQLIAGPIVQYKQIFPQLERKQFLKVTWRNLSVGLTIFFIGLFKKIALADSVAIYANTVFAAADHGVNLSFWEAWAGTLAYGLQLYFDFSGYSDMAIGLGLLFGIKLPINFNSPYKALNIIDFWRRWHITLSVFLRDYLYISLGGNRKGKLRRYLNLMLTMLIGGLWHGAHWTFMLWGGMHGLYLVINHAFRSVTSAFGLSAWMQRLPMRILSQMLTIFAVFVAWVPFRAENIQVTMLMYKRMFSLEYMSLPGSLVERFSWLKQLGLASQGVFYNQLADWHSGLVLILGLLFISLVMPNTLQFMGQYVHKHRSMNAGHWDLIADNQFGVMTWRPTLLWAAVTALMMIISIMLLSGESEFLYFQF